MKVLLVQWDEEAAAQRIERLKRAGHDVLCETQDGAEAYRIARGEQLDAVVLDLDTKPSHSWQIARPLAKLAQAPRLIFVGGGDKARQRAAKEAPAAAFVAPDDLEGALA